MYSYNGTHQISNSNIVRCIEFLVWLRATMTPELLQFKYSTVIKINSSTVNMLLTKLCNHGLGMVMVCTKLLDILGIKLMVKNTTWVKPSIKKAFLLSGHLPTTFSDHELHWGTHYDDSKRKLKMGFVHKIACPLAIASPLTTWAVIWEVSLYSYVIFTGFIP